MKKETIITAAVFFGVGFLAGYVYNAQKNASVLESQARGAAVSQRAEDEPSATAPADAAGTPGGSLPLGALPPGHPPIDSTATSKLLEDRAAAHPSDPRPQLELANFLYDQKQFEQAIPWYQKVLELDPKNVSARTDLGTAYFNLGRATEAVREYRQSLEVDPNHQPTLYNMILVNLDGTHDLAQARAAWQKLSRLNPSYPGLEMLKERVDPAGGQKADGRRR